MRMGFAAALMVAPSMAGAADIELSSRVERVTVYPDGAVVTRLGTARIEPGASQLLIGGLPAGIDPSSIRIEGKGDGPFSIGAVDVRAAARAAPPANPYEQELKALRDEKMMLADKIAAIQAKRRTIERFAQTGPDKLGSDGKALPVADWTAVFEAIGTALVQVHAELRAAQARLAEVNAELGRHRPLPPGFGVERRDVVVAVEAGAAVAAELTLSYRVAGASWTPVYEARLTTAGASGKPELAFERRAELRQRTGEDWSDVALTLSTTRSAGGTAAPDLAPVQVAFFEPPVVYETRQRAAPAPLAKGRAELQADAALAPPAAEPQQARVQTATLDAAPYQANFQVPGRVSVPQDGSSKTVLLSRGQARPVLSAKAAPELDERAYLEASFVHEEEAPLIAGEVHLHRDGSFIGRGRLSLVAPGEKVALGFGADDKIRVKRAPVRRRESEPGWIGQNRSDLREFRTVVKSLHAQPVTVTVLDRVPFSENGAISVELLPQTTAPSEKQVADKRGVSAWSFELAPGAEKEIRLAYRIKWPGDRELTYEQQGRPGPLPPR